MIRKLDDTYKHKGWRKMLVDELREKGISNEQVLQAINTVPRHFFLDAAFEQYAYENRAFPIGEGQTISHPYTVAYQTNLLDLQKYDKVLEIGTGSAYQCSILAEMGVQVYTIERQKKLYTHNQKHFPFANKYRNIKFFYGDGFEGLPTFAPFDKVLITAAAPFVPEKLLAQMKIGGYMVLPENEEDGENQRMKRLTKTSETAYTEELFDTFTFVPMLGGKAH